MKNKYIVIFLFFIINFKTTANAMENNTFYDFKIESLMGETILLDTYRGKPILLVNVASNCGFTKQYSELEYLWNRYKEKNLIILGVPSNQFGNQEPGTNKEIKEFCKVNFNITFQMTSKYDVKGDNAHDIFKWAKKSHGISAVPKWNFHKILIDKSGKVHDTFAPFTKPTSKKIIKAIEKVLN